MADRIAEEQAREADVGPGASGVPARPVSVAEAQERRAAGSGKATADERGGDAPATLHNLVSHARKRQSPWQHEFAAKRRRRMSWTDGLKPRSRNRHILIDR